MESHGFPMCIHVRTARPPPSPLPRPFRLATPPTGLPRRARRQLSAAAREELVREGVSAERFESRGETKVKGKGLMHTFVVKAGEWQAALHHQQLLTTVEAFSSSAL